MVHRLTNNGKLLILAQRAASKHSHMYDKNVTLLAPINLWAQSARPQSEDMILEY